MWNMRLVEVGSLEKVTIQDPSILTDIILHKLCVVETLSWSCSAANHHLTGLQCQLSPSLVSTGLGTTIRNLATIHFSKFCFSNLARLVFPAAPRFRKTNGTLNIPINASSIKEKF